MKTFAQHFNEMIETKEASKRRKMQHRKLTKKEDPWKTKREPREKFQTGALTPVKLRQHAVSAAKRTSNVGGGTYIPKG